MRLKSFGLIEAIIGSAILIIFIVALGLLSLRANQVLVQSQHRQIAQKIAKDYLSRVFILRDAGKITFSSEDRSRIPIECFSTDKGSSCLGSIIDSYPDNLFPFFEMIQNQSTDSWKPLKKEYLSTDNVEENFYSIKTEVRKIACHVEQTQSLSCREIMIDVLWPEKSGNKIFRLNQFISEL